MSYTSELVVNAVSTSSKIEPQWFIVRGWLDEQEWGSEPPDPDDVWAVGDRVRLKNSTAEGTVCGEQQKPFLNSLYLPFYGVAEIDPYCNDILSKRYPNVPNYGDLRELAIAGKWGLSLGDIDLITASPPCPPFSVEGKRQGAADERDCFPSVLRIIDNHQPRFAVIENVPGILNCPYTPGDERGYFRFVLEQLQECGYNAEWLVVGSGHFAAPFIRERVLLVAISRSLKLDWEKATPWADQARITIETIKHSCTGGSYQPGVSRECLQSSTWVDRPTGQQIRLGIPKGDRTTRARRAALGNALDWRVATVALQRVIYLHQLSEL